MRVAWPIRLWATTIAMIAATFTTSATKARASPPPARDVIAVLVGANVGSTGEEPLRFAASDARRVRDLLTELGDVGAGNPAVLSGGSPDEVFQALQGARQRVAEMAARGRRSTFVFYYSGHGDDDALHLARGTLPLRALRAAIADVPADLRVSILDACRTGGRGKGVTHGPAFDLAVAPSGPHGTVELRAASAGEAAQESDELGGAVFTHFLVSGLRGGADANGDGRVTLEELYDYAYSRTLLKTANAPVLQHPSFDVNLAGAGDLVLTYPSAAPAFLEVPGGSQRYLVFRRPSDVAMGEISGQASGRLALPAGRFFVVRRSEGSTAVAMVDLSGGGTKRLGDSDFRAISREELVARGGHLELEPWRLDARVGGEFSPAGGDAFSLRVGAAIAYSLGAFEIEMDLAYVGGSFSSDAFSGWVHSIAASPSLALRIDAGRLTLSPFLGAEVRYSWERLTRADAGRTIAAGLPVQARYDFASAGPRA
jgi:hypothetical protein